MQFLEKITILLLIKKGAARWLSSAEIAKVFPRYVLQE